MRPMIDQVDFLLDIHSMHDPHGPVMISGPLAKGIDGFIHALARLVDFPTDRGGIIARVWFWIHCG